MGQTEISLLMKDINKPSIKLFKKIEYLGRGGFGHVWKVLFCKGDYYLAMKQLSKKEIKRHNLVSNLFSERDILNFIYNIHIVNLYLTFQDENYLYMILDYLEGGDLRKHMNEKIFNLKEIKFVAACIIIGLEYIHKKGIIHRDIKPENLIFDDKGFLRLSDFGISINNETISKREKNNDKSGTPGYMAPERIINDKNISYGYSSDFFSLGVILYELAMLKKPFRRNLDKIGRYEYNSFEDIIQDLFNNENINITPSMIKNSRNNENNNKNNNKVDTNLCNVELIYLCDLINKLLIYNQEERLGYDNIEDIKNHPFFGERFEWKKIYHRSLKSPFNTFKFKNKKNENDKINDIVKMDIIDFETEDEKIKFQNNFKDFTLIHKITKEDFNYFYLNNTTKYRESNKKIIKNPMTDFSKKHINFFSQKKDDINNNNKIKYKLIPNKLFKEKINNLININKNKNLSSLNSLKKIKIMKEIKKDNFIDNICTKTNFNFFKKNYYNYLPKINTERDSRRITLKKPNSALINKNRTKSTGNYKKNNNKILISKNCIKHKDSYFNLIIKLKDKSKNKTKRDNMYFLTESNINLINNSIKTSRKINENNLLKINEDNIINIHQYKGKINKLNNNNNEKAINKIFHK